MGKNIKIILFCVGILLLSNLMIKYCDNKIHNESSYQENIKEYDWNNGRCIYDNTKLEYTKTGNKEHYVCPTCKREFTFDFVGSYK